MKTINAVYEIINKKNINGLELLKGIEVVGRTCYKSEDNITNESAKKFVATLIKNGHEAMIEHNAISVRFICDRGVSHELVRHRLASFGQESTRYCNYSKDKFGNELTFIKPLFFLDEENKLEISESDFKENKFSVWETVMRNVEKAYFMLLDMGASPQEARSVLPNSLKTEIVMTMNLREWRHFFSLRADKPAHPQMRELTMPLLKEISELIPIVFDDLVAKLLNESEE